MIRRMDSYVAATVLKALAVVLLCLLTVVTLFTVIDELNDITPGYTKAHAFLYVLYSTPRRLTELMPYGVFMAALVGLGQLASREEVTALRAAGVSVGRLFVSVGATAVAVLALNLGVAEWLAPAGEAAASTLKLRVVYGDGGPTIRAGHWYREGGLYTTIDAYGVDGELFGVRQYALDEGGEVGRLRLSRRAERATFAHDEQGRHWLLHDVVETRFGPNATTVRRLDLQAWRSDADPALLGAKALFDPAKLSFADLAFQIGYLRAEGLDPSRYQVAFWAKAAQPVAVLGLVLLALGFVLGPLRETGMGARLTVGIAVGLAFKYFLDLFGPVSIVFDMPPWLAMAAPVAACWLAGLAQLRRL